MDDQAAQEEIQHLRQEIQEIDAELARLRTERRLFGRSSFSPEWLILRQRSLNTDRDRCQSRLRELARAGYSLPRHLGPAGGGASTLKTAVYGVSGLAVVLIVAAVYLTMGHGRAATPAATTVATPTATATPIPQPTATPTPAVTIYKVVSGDTLSKIAQQYGVTVDDIANANKLTRSSILQVGQEMVIPPAPTPTPAAAPASPKP